jgi:hypothetical protein
MGRVEREDEIERNAVSHDRMSIAGTMHMEAQQEDDGLIEAHRDTACHDARV